MEAGVLQCSSWGAGTCSFQMCLLSLETWPTVSPMRAMSMLRRSTKVRMM